ncbi:MAG: OB-fold domain-containing protein [Acidimicrobiales bacterium]
MPGLISYGTYIPRHRLSRADIGAALGAGGGKGSRAVAGYDEDATSMGVEAARQALRRAGDAGAPQRLLYATANPPYLDKTNANLLHAALRLPTGCLAVDVCGSVRSAAGALLMGAETPGSALVVVSDVRTGLPGGADERDGGDAAAAFLFGDGAEPIAEVVAEASATDEFLDRWRLPGAVSSRVWEERFGEHVYVPLAESAFNEMLKKSGLSPSEIDVVVVAGLHGRAVRSFAASCGAGRVADDMSTSIGNPGAAQAGMILANVLDTAQPDQTIAVVTLADGATAMALRTTEAIAQHRPDVTVAAQIGHGGMPVRYADFLSWRGLLSKEPPRRPDPQGPAAPPTHRSSRYKYGFVAHRCEECSTVHLPAVRVCVNCKAVDRMVEEPMADKTATIATYTVDHLAFSPSPPVIAAVIDFDGGGRLSCELTDAAPDQVAIGDRVEMSFRRLTTASGIHNYFWKARPVRS